MNADRHPIFRGIVALPVAAYLEYISPDLKNRPTAMAMNWDGVAILQPVPKTDAKAKEGTGR